MGIKKALLAKVEAFSQENWSTSVVNEMENVQSAVAELALESKHVAVISDLTVQLRTLAQAGVSCRDAVGVVARRVSGWLSVADVVVLALDEPESMPKPKLETQRQRDDAARGSQPIFSDDLRATLGDDYRASEQYDSPLLKLYSSREARSRVVDFVAGRIAQKLSSAVGTTKTVIMDGVDPRGDRRKPNAPRSPIVTYLGVNVEFSRMDTRRRTGEADIKLVQWSDLVHAQHVEGRRAPDERGKCCAVLSRLRAVVVETNDTDAVVTHGILAATKYRDLSIDWTEDFHVLVCLFRASNIPRPSVKAARAEGRPVPSLRPRSWYAVVSGTQLSELVSTHIFAESAAGSSSRTWAASLLAAGVATIGCDFVTSFASMSFGRLMAGMQTLCQSHPLALAAMRHLSADADADVLLSVESVALLMSLCRGRHDPEPTYETVTKAVWTVAYWLNNERSAEAFGWLDEVELGVSSPPPT